jgi:DNA-directed RNA polymerase specialized sigma24 family protein
VNDALTPIKTQKLSYLPNLTKIAPIFRTISRDPDRNGWLGSKSMATLEEKLEDFIFKHCRETIPQPQRVAEMNAILRDINKDRRFLQYRNSENPDDYEDALRLMWRHFERNLCEATTARKVGSYYKTRTYAVNRLLASLKGNLQNIRKNRYQEEAKKEQPRMDSDGVYVDPLDELPSPESEPEPEYDPAGVWKIFLELLEENSTGELNDKANTLHGVKASTRETTKEPYTLTAQTYLLMRHRDGMTIQQIADELDIPRGAVQGGAKPTRWRDLARKFAQMAMIRYKEGSHDTQQQ